MGRFDRRDNNRRGGGGGFDRRPTTMYPAVCDKCGKDCQVPFRPSGDKPIYCSNCFEKEGSGKSDRFERRDNSRRSFGGSRERGDKQMFSAICDECGAECKVPFNPSPDKPIYCSKCFEKREGTNRTGNNSSFNNDKQSEKLDSIIEKLDKMLIALESKIPSEENKVVKKPKSVKKSKTVKKTETK